MNLQGSLLIGMGGSGMVLVRDVVPTTAGRSLDSATRFVGRSIGLFDGDSPPANAHGSGCNHDEGAWPRIDMAGLGDCFGTATAAPARVRLSVTRDGMFVEVEPSRSCSRGPERQSSTARGYKSAPLS
jgi:hypothetical protein